jgi:hypothetical protein
MADPIVRFRVPSRWPKPDAVALVPLVLAPVELALAATSPRAVVPNRLPDDEVPDSLLDRVLAVRRANERYPVESVVTTQTPSTLREAFTQAAQHRFLSTLSAIDPRVTARLEQPFGKDNLSQYFYSTPGLRHVLLPLWKSGFLHDDGDASWEVLCDTYYPASVLRDLLREYEDTPFHGIRGFPSGWESETVVNDDRVAMATAALLHFNGSVANLVPWIGGPHVGAHRDHHAILDTLQSAGVDTTPLAVPPPTRPILRLSTAMAIIPP